VIVSSAEFNAQSHAVVVRAISSDLTRSYGDFVLKAWRESGLLLPSRVTAWMKTLPGTALIGRLGVLRVNDWQEVAATTHHEVLAG
jgi:hypothetical protein